MCLSIFLASRIFFNRRRRTRWRRIHNTFMGKRALAVPWRLPKPYHNREKSEASAEVIFTNVSYCSRSDNSTQISLRQIHAWKADHRLSGRLLRPLQVERFVLAPHIQNKSGVIADSNITTITPHGNRLGRLQHQFSDQEHPVIKNSPVCRPLRLASLRSVTRARLCTTTGFLAMKPSEWSL